MFVPTGTTKNFIGPTFNSHACIDCTTENDRLFFELQLLKSFCKHCGYVIVSLCIAYHKGRRREAHILHEVSLAATKLKHVISINNQRKDVK